MTDFEALDADWLQVEEALERVLARAQKLPHEDVPLSEALARVLARTVSARVTLPPWDNSAMDGYAVRSADIAAAVQDHPVELSVVGAVKAGEEPSLDVDAGEAVRIMTGAPVPDGADSIVRVEDTDRESDAEGRVRVFSDRDRGRNVRSAGRDARSGEPVLASGAVVGAGQVAVLASQGYDTVRVHRRPVVAILPNGDELASLESFDAVLEGRAVPESNGPALAAATRLAGAEPRCLPIAPDDPAAILERVDASLDADALVTIGGASMGEADLLKRVLARRGYEVDFWRVRMRPGSPFGLGVLPRADGSSLPVFGLPGNPGSAYVTFQIFVRPFLLALAGHDRIHRPTVHARAREPLSTSAPLAYFFRVILREDGEGDWTFELAGAQGSGLVQSLGRSDGLAVVPPHVDRVGEGDRVTVISTVDGPGWRRDAGF